MTIVIILTLINFGIGYFIYFRLGKQSVMDDLLKAYREECRENEELRKEIGSLMIKIKHIKDGKE